jgi:glutaredoxin
MEVQIIATHECRHRLDLERELLELGIPFDLVFVEDNEDLVRRYQIRHSPNLVIDGVVVFRGQPTEGQLRDLFAKLPGNGP